MLAPSGLRVIYGHLLRPEGTTSELSFAVNDARRANDNWVYDKFA